MKAVAPWHPISLSASVKPGTCTGAHLLGRELAVWRDQDGAAHVWEDRCPHRGMRLSFGFVRGNRLSCLYHGWRFTNSGQCDHIPAHPNLAVPETIAAQSYPAFERHGMIWTSLDPVSVPSSVSSRDANVLPVRSLYFETARERVLEQIKCHAFTSFAEETAGPAELTCLTDNLYSLFQDADRLLLGLQALSETRTGVHIVIQGEHRDDEGAGQVRFLHWANRLRDRMRNKGAGRTFSKNIKAASS